MLHIASMLLPSMQLLTAADSCLWTKHNSASAGTAEGARHVKAVCSQRCGGRLTRVRRPAVCIVHISLPVSRGSEKRVQLVVLHIDGHAPPILVAQPCNAADGLLGLPRDSQGVDVIAVLGADTCTTAWPACWTPLKGTSEQYRL